MTFETISVVGLGYIGLPTAAVFAAHGVRVNGVDVSQHVVDTINAGKIHIVEPNLDEIVQKAVADGKLVASLDVVESDAFLIAVPTPFKSNDSTIPEPDLSYVESAAKQIAPVLKKGDLVILESTSPVGATEKLTAWLAESRPDLEFPCNGNSADVFVAHCPERVLPGQVVRELVENDRVVGGLSDACSQKAVALYRTFVKGDCVVTNSRTAEMAKLTENSFRDVNIAFANELSVICDELSIDVWELIALANRHPRVNILQPGPGVGGHCIAVDPWFIVSSAPQSSRLIHTARTVNDAKPEWVLEKVKVAISDFLQANSELTVKDVTIACYGLAFKPNIDDLRESPALKIAQTIQEMHVGTSWFVEPNISELPEKLSQGELMSLPSALDNAHIHVLLVDHTQFKSLRPESGVIVDTRGIWK